MSNLDSLNDKLTASIDLLGEAIIEIKDIDLSTKKEAIDNIVAAIGSVFYAKSFIPDPREVKTIPDPDPPLTPEQQIRVSELEDYEIELIDEMLLAQADVRWRKVARIVGFAMTQENNPIRNISDIYYSHRVRHLVERGKLESQGNLDYMGYSEVRLPESKGSAQS